MSDAPAGPGWWEASDGKWYAPELHPDHRPPAPPPPGPPDEPPATVTPASLTGLEPPPVHEWVSDSPIPPGGPPPRRYPEVGAGRPGRWSTGRVVAVVFGGLFLLVAGGCGALAWIFRDEIADAAIDFSDAEVVDEPASCRVTGVDLGDDYEIEATLRATRTSVPSHFRLDLEVSAGDRLLGEVEGVLRSVEPGEERTEGVFNTIPATDPVGDTVCSVVRVLRVDA